MGYEPDIEHLLGGAESPKAMVGGAYEGADRFSNTLALWQPPLRSADMDILPEKPLADARARDEMRNDGYAVAGANIQRNSIVGAIFLLNAKPETTILGLDDTWEEEFQEEVETKFTVWAESLNNWPDAARRNTLTELVRLAVGVTVASGEMLASVEWIREPGRLFNTAIQMIDVDRLSNPYGVMDDQFLRGGVVRDRYGAPQGYHVRVAHPSDWTVPDSYQWKYVPARKPWGRVQMLHFFEQTRPDQTRGISEIVAGLKEMRITKHFRDIVLQNAVLNASYAASIESELPSETVFAQLGGGNLDAKSINAAITGYANAYLGAIAEYAGAAKNLRIDGVKIPHLFPGTKLQLRPAGQGGPLGTDFEASLLRYLAAIFNCSYEELSRDYSKTSYAGHKAGAANTERAMASKKKMTADRFASSVYRLWLEEAINKGEITSLPRNAPSWYEGMNADAYAAADWIGASKGQIDELKETQAAVLRINNNLSTREIELARLGRDFRKIFRQLKREKKMQVADGIWREPGGDQNTKNALTAQPDEKQGTEEKGASE